MTFNLKDEEFVCRCGCGEMRIAPATALVWQMVRDHFGKPVRITSGCRCSKHNEKVGGSPNSQHKPWNGECRAADGQIDGVSPIEIYEFVDKMFPNSLGLGVYDTFVHIDSRMDREYRWDNRSKA